MRQVDKLGVHKCPAEIWEHLDRRLIINFNLVSDLSQVGEEIQPQELFKVVFLDLAWFQLK
jgi:hypothetical protein